MFITLTSRRTNLPVQVRPDLISAVVHDEKPGAFVHVGHSGWAIQVTESVPEILALISGGAGDEAVTDEMVRAAAHAYCEVARTDCGWDDMRYAIAAALRARPRS